MALKVVTDKNIGAGLLIESGVVTVNVDGDTIKVENGVMKVDFANARQGGIGVTDFLLCDTNMLCLDLADGTRKTIDLTNMLGRSKADRFLSSATFNETTKALVLTTKADGEEDKEISVPLSALVDALKVQFGDSETFRLNEIATATFTQIANTENGKEALVITDVTRKPLIGINVQRIAHNDNEYAGTIKNTFKLVFDVPENADMIPIRGVVKIADYSGQTAATEVIYERSNNANGYIEVFLANGGLYVHFDDYLPNVHSSVTTFARSFAVEIEDGLGGLAYEYGVLGMYDTENIEVPDHFMPNRVLLNSI